MIGQIGRDNANYLKNSLTSSEVHILLKTAPKKAIAL